MKPADVILVQSSNNYGKSIYQATVRALSKNGRAVQIETDAETTDRDGNRINRGLISVSWVDAKDVLDSIKEAQG